MLQHHIAIRAAFNTHFAKCSRGLVQPRDLSMVEARIERFRLQHEIYMAQYTLELLEAKLIAFDVAVAQAARVLHTTDQNMILAAVRRAGLAYRNGEVVVH